MKALLFLFANREHLRYFSMFPTYVCNKISFDSRKGDAGSMAAFIFFMLGCLAGFGAIAYLIYRGIQNDTYNYDLEFVWDQLPVTKEQMEFK